MGRHDRIAATIIVSMLAVLWLGFLVHRAPFFAGSLWGGVFGIVGAAVASAAGLAISNLLLLPRLWSRGRIWAAVVGRPRGPAVVA